MPRAEPGLSPSGKGQILPQAVQADEARVWVGQIPAGRMFPRSGRSNSCRLALKSKDVSPSGLKPLASLCSGG